MIESQITLILELAEACATCKAEIVLWHSQGGDHEGHMMRVADLGDARAALESAIRAGQEAQEPKREIVLEMARDTEDCVTWYMIHSPLAPGLNVCSPDFDACMSDVRTAWEWLDKNSPGQVQPPPKRMSIDASPTPIAGEPTARQPLSDEQIYQMYSEPSSDAEMLEFAREIERAHGIGAKP